MKAPISISVIRRWEIKCFQGGFLSPAGSGGKKKRGTFFAVPFWAFLALSGDGELFAGGIGAGAFVHVPPYHLVFWRSGDFLKRGFGESGNGGPAPFFPFFVFLFFFVFSRSGPPWNNQGQRFFFPVKKFLTRNGKRFPFF